jgi:hypothetical protein
MRLRTVFLLFPWLWLLMTAFTRMSGHPWTSNLWTVKRLAQTVTDFQKEQNRLPESLAELRGYGESMGERPDIYDNYGHQLFYQPLTEAFFLVKSFGRDEAENTILTSKDDAFSNVPYPPRGIRQILPTDSRMSIFQGAALDGLQAPRTNLFATLQKAARPKPSRQAVFHGLRARCSR